MPMNRVLCGLLAASAAAFGEVEFNRDVRPILSDRCYACHATDAARKGIKLRLDREDSARAAVLSGELVRRITEPSAARRMPPVHTGQKLSEPEIATLRAWADAGAPWQGHWAFLSPVKRPLPLVSDAASPGAIDAWVISRLNREGLKPAPEATREALLRRASFDITGVPPSPEEIAAFVKDRSPDAYEKQLDRLLASPRYGERMAIRWLDAARYADTNGYQTDAPREMWRWRDWVIDAFNSNMPFDRFAVEQLAGDLLPGATLSQRVATGFNRNHRGNSEGGIVPEEYLAEYSVDRVETMSTVFLGLTLGCARCHNHKYDPFTQKEFYQLFAYFNNINEPGRYFKFGNSPPWVKAPTAAQQAERQRLEQRAAETTKAFAALDLDTQTKARAWAASQTAEWQYAESLLFAAAAVPAEMKQQGNFNFDNRFSVAFRMRARPGGGAVLHRSELSDEEKGWGLYWENGRLEASFIVRKLDDAIRVDTPLDTEWHHIVLSYDGTRLAGGVQLYVDGQPRQLNHILDALNQDFRSSQPLRVGDGAELRDLRIYSDVLTPAEAAVLAAGRPLDAIGRDPAASPAESHKLRLAYLDVGAPAPVRESWTAMRQAIRERDSFERAIPTVMVMEEMETPRATFVLDRGVYDRPAERVERATPAALPPLPADAPRNRLGLARWMASRENPLTARVFVNRVWQMVFGTGLVKTPEDFGSQGEWPSHPELLDWLAADFMDNGWDVKRLMKTILASSTYRQSSAASAELAARDPENRLLARGPRVRLAAEMVRDQALAASGLLVEKRGGPSVKPYQPAGLWSDLGGADYQRDSGEGLYRRSLYTVWKRTAPPPFMMNFDSAGRESCTVREWRTNTPLQALNLMNDVTFLEAARHVARRALDTPDPIAEMFLRVVSRHPSNAERSRLSAALAYYRDHFGTDKEAALHYLSQGERKTEAQNPAELAAHAAVASLILNLDEALVK